jgi:phosphoribosylformylglycinamidine cyclo-ligase
LARAGNIDAHEMARTFNCGIGMALIVAADHADQAKALLTKAGEKVFCIGQVEPYTTGERVVLEKVSKGWPC